MKVSILTVTKRNGWLPLAVKSLREQTYKRFEWVIVYEPDVEVGTIEGIDNFKWASAPPKTRHSNLNASLNEGLRNCAGDYVVFYQDFIQLEADTVGKLLNHCVKTGGFITTATINPDGQHDDRYTGVGGLRQCRPEQWETNVAIAPMEALKKLGGFYEELDNGWSWDNVNVAQRAEMLGYEFFIDESIQPQLMYHPKEPDLDPTLELNYMRNEMHISQIRAGKSPIKLNHL